MPACVKSGLLFLIATAIGMVLTVNNMSAATTTIVALGASNTAGKGVGSTGAWPAQLEAMLRARGYDVTVANAGISGDDTSGMAACVGSAVPNGTKLVIMEKAATNDRSRGRDTGANVAAVNSQLRARGIKLIVIPALHTWANHHLQPDGIHVTEEGHRAIAAHLLPLVIAAIGRR